MGVSAPTAPARSTEPRRARPLPGAAPLALLALLGAACSDAQTQLARGRLEVPVASLDLGAVPLFNERVQTVEVRNAGRAPVTLLQVAIQAPDGSPGAFAVGAAPAALDAGETAQIEVRFTPEAVADYSATLAIASDDPVNPSVQVALSGRGSTAAAVQADSAVDFGKVCEGAQAIGWLNLRSTGDAALILEAIRFADGTAPEFSFAASTKAGTQVPAGGSLALALRFSPTSSTGATASGAVVLTTTDPAHRSFQVSLTASVDRAPVAAIAALPDAAPGASVVFDGSASSDLDGDLPLAYSWALKASPIGSAAQPSPLNAAQAGLTLDLPGAYELALTVQDAFGCTSAPAFQEVLAKPAQKLLVELTWDNPLTDLDLHLAPAGADFFGPSDCYYAQGHMHPDWGVQGDSSDDPSLDRDALVGFGPEIISYANPAPGTYQAMAYFYSDHGAASPSTVATVRVFELGVIKAELKKTLAAAGGQWLALTVNWPSGAVVATP